MIETDFAKLFEEEIASASTNLRVSRANQALEEIKALVRKAVDAKHTDKAIASAATKACERSEKYKGLVISPYAVRRFRDEHLGGDSEKPADGPARGRPRKSAAARKTRKGETTKTESPDPNEAPNGETQAIETPKAEVMAEQPNAEVSVNETVQRTSPIDALIEQHKTLASDAKVPTTKPL